MTFPAIKTAPVIVSSVMLAGILVAPCRLAAQTQSSPTQTKRAAPGVGVQGFGVAGVNWLSAHKSLEATGLERQQMEFGGGVQATRLWRDLFARVTASRFSADGERVFVNSAGVSTPLGIPLTVKATYVDVTAGWTMSPDQYARRHLTLPYVGAGVGRVKYSEQSPFAEPGDDLEATQTSYHVLAGVHYGVLRWLGVAVDARYRWVPDLFGEGGASQAFAEKKFGGFDLAVGVTVGFWGRRPIETPVRVPSVDDTTKTGRELFKVPERVQSATSNGVITSAAPVFLRPDATLTPLRILEVGASVRILDEAEEWIQIEFSDSQWGPRVGYVQRKNIRLPKR